uniref:Uncharacterized protein n=1 Tax=Oryza punctata TaxID=4537 RepID=A0A0E0LJF2_ORYPU
MGDERVRRNGAGRAGLVADRFRFSGHGKKRKREPESQSAHDDDDGRAHVGDAPRLVEDLSPPAQPVPPPAVVVNSVSLTAPIRAALAPFVLLQPSCTIPMTLTSPISTLP